MRQSQFFFAFFCLLKVLRPGLYGLGYPTQPHGEQLLTTWPPRMRTVPPFGLRNTVKNFTKRSMKISLTWSKIVLFLLKRQYVRMSLKSSSKKECMNLSLNSVFSKYTANSNFPTPLALCLFSTTSTIHLFKNSAWLSSRTGKKNVPSCSCLRCPKSTSHSSRFPAHSKYEKNSFYIVVKFEGERHRCTEDMNQEVKRSTPLLF